MSMNSQAGVSAEPPTLDDEFVLSFGDLLRVIWRRAWIIALLTLVFVGLALGASFLLQTPTYEASVKILVSQSQQGGDTQSNLGSDVQGLQGLTGTVVEAVNGRAVAGSVIKKLNLNMEPDDFLENLNAEQIPNTLLVEVSYRDTNPERAQKIANAIGEELGQRISRINPSANPITADVLEPATVPDTPVSPKPLRNGFLGLVLGAMLGIGLAFLLENLDDSWRSPEEAEQISGVPTFGVVPEFQIPKSKEKK